MGEASRSGTITIRNGKTGLPVRVIANLEKDAFFVNAMEYQRGTVWSGDSVGTLRGYQSDGLDIRHVYKRGAQAGIKSLFAHPKHDSDVLWAAGEDWNVSVHASATSEFLRKLGGHTTWVRCLCLDQYHRRLWSGADDGVRIWHRDHILIDWKAPTKEDEEEQDLCFFHIPNSQGVITLCAEGNHVWGGFQDGYIMIWRASDYKCLHRFKAFNKAVTTIKLIDHEIFTASMMSSDVHVYTAMAGDDPPSMVSTLKVPLKSKVVDIVKVKRHVWFGGRAPGALFLYTLPKLHTKSRRKDKKPHNSVDVDGRTFCRWAQLVLEESDKYKDDVKLEVAEPFTVQMTDGVVFGALLDTLDVHEVQIPHPKPVDHDQKIENMEYILSTMKKMHIHLPEYITAEHMVGNKGSEILDTVWELIRKYHLKLGYADDRTEEAMMNWVNIKIAPTIAEEDNIEKVTNFDWGWSDGYSLSALVDRQEPGCIAFGKLEREDPIWNIQTAMETAKSFDIPQVMDTEDICYAPCSRSMLTQIGFFHQAAKQVVDPSMSYVRGPNEGTNDHHYSSEDWADASKKKLFSKDENYEEPQIVEFTVFANDEEGAPVEKSTLEVIMEGPEGLVNVESKNNGDGTYTCSYAFPLPPGDYKLDSKLNGDSVSNCPLEFTVKKSVDPAKSYAEGSGLEGETYLDKTDKSGRNEVGMFTINALDEDGEFVMGTHCDVKMVGPNGPVFIEVKDNGDGTFECKYDGPLIPGDYTLSTKLDGMEIGDGPRKFNVKRIADPSKCFAKGYGLRGPDDPHNKNRDQLGFQIHLLDKYDSHVKDAEVEAKIIGPNGEIIKTTLVPKRTGIYDCTYSSADTKPPGKYMIECSVDGQPIGKPFQFDVKKKADTGKSYMEGPGLTAEGCENGLGNFMIHPLDEDGNPVSGTKIEVSMKGPDGDVPLKITKDENGFDLEVEYDPNLGPGEYIISCHMDGKLLEGMPKTFTIKKKPCSESCYAEGPGLDARRPTHPPGETSEDNTKFTVYSVDDEKKPVLESKCEVKMDRVTDMHAGKLELESVTVNIIDNGDGTFDCNYKDAVEPDGELPPGHYVISVSVNGLNIRDMPVSLTIPERAAASLSYITGPGLSSHKIGSGRSCFDIIAKDCHGKPSFVDPSRLKLSIRDPSGLVFNVNSGKQMVHSEIKVESKTSNAVDPATGDRITHRVTYIPKKAGKYVIDVKSDKASLKNAPVELILKKGGSGKHTSGMKCVLTVVAIDAQDEAKTEGGDDFYVLINDEDGEEAKAELIDNNDGLYTAKFSLIKPALYTSVLKINGQEMGISPLVSDLRLMEEKLKDSAIVVYAGDNNY